MCASCSPRHIRNCNLDYHKMIPNIWSHAFQLSHYLLQNRSPVPSASKRLECSWGRSQNRFAGRWTRSHHLELNPELYAALKPFCATCPLDQEIIITGSLEIGNKIFAVSWKSFLKSWLLVYFRLNLLLHFEVRYQINLVLSEVLMFENWHTEFCYKNIRCEMFLHVI